MSRSAFPRRRFLQNGCAALGLSLPEFLRLRKQASANYLASGRIGKAKSCIVLYCWGGMSHHETWDPKPLAPREIRGEFQPIATATPGIMVSEHIPHLAQQTERLAIVRSIHHNSSAHGKGMYWNMTGHAPPQATTATNIPPTPEDWPSLGAMVSKFRNAPRGMPRSVRLPYPLVDNGTLQAGEYGGWMGQQFDPIVIRTPGGKPFGGVSRSLGAAELNLSQEVDLTRLTRRNNLLSNLETPLPPEPGIKQLLHFRQLASDMLLNPEVKVAFDLDHESPKTLERYGNHIGGRSMLLARRLSEAGVPLVTVCCAAGDLNGSRGDHWDTHGDNFNRLKKTMLPSFDRPAATLLDDLADRGLLDHTLVVILTEFGRTPKINGGAGRDHYPGVYSVVLAGGGVSRVDRFMAVLIAMAPTLTAARANRTTCMQQSLRRWEFLRMRCSTTHSIAPCQSRMAARCHFLDDSLTGRTALEDMIFALSTSWKFGYNRAIFPRQVPNNVRSIHAR